MNKIDNALCQKYYNTLLEELEYITKLNYKIHMGMDFIDLINQVLYSLRKIVHFDGCNFSLIDENGKMKLHPIRFEEITDKLTSKIPNEIIEYLFTLEFDYETSPIWICKVAREDTEIYIPEIKSTEDYPEAKMLLETLGITSMFYLPIKLENRIMGTLAFSNYGGTMYLDEFEKDIIRRRTVIIARAIENSRIYNQIKKQNNELEKYRNNIDNDLILANKIQQSFVPIKLPQIENVIISAKYIPMHTVGGDYYDFIEIDNHSFGVLITDVSGHGIQAALITGMLKMIVESEKAKSIAHEPDNFLNFINNAVINKIAGNFITAIYVYFNLKVKKIKICCAGHQPLYIINQNSITGIHPKGRILGFSRNIDFETIEMDIEKNSRYFFYTDGLVETLNEKAQTFEESLIEILKNHNQVNPENLNSLIIQRLKKHATGKQHFDDDIAMVTIDCFRTKK